MLSDQYLAGLFDGEGSVGVYRHKAKDTFTTVLKVQVGQMASTESETIFNFLKEKYGGAISRQTKRGGSKYLLYQLSRRKAVALLRDIYPYVVIKKTQISEAITWYDSKHQWERGRDDSAIVQSLSDLKRPWRRKIYA